MALFIDNIGIPTDACVSMGGKSVERIMVTKNNISTIVWEKLTDKYIWESGEPSQGHFPVVSNQFQNPEEGIITYIEGFNKNIDGNADADFSFDYRNGCYGMHFQHLNADKESGDFNCMMVIKIDTKGYSSICLKGFIYTPEEQKESGAQTFWIDGNKTDASGVSSRLERELFSNQEFTFDVSGLTELELMFLINASTWGSGDEGTPTIDCDIGLYLEYIYLKE